MKKIAGVLGYFGVFVRNLLVPCILISAHAHSSSLKPASQDLSKTNSVKSLVVAYVGINELYKVDPVEGTFFADITIDYEWSDPLSSDETDDADRDVRRELSDPRLEFVNDRNVNLIWESYSNSHSDKLDYRATRRYNGEFSALFDLGEFPFDEQKLQVIIEPRGKTTKEISLVFNSSLSNSDILGPERLLKHIMPVNSYSSINDWEFTGAKLHLFEHKYAQDDDIFPRLSIDLTLVREFQHYIYMVIGIMLCITLICFSAYFFSKDDIGSRLQVLTALLLSITAFQFVVYADLPVIPYLTIMDLMFIFSYICILSIIVTTVGVKYIADHKDLDAAARAEKKVMPVIFISYIIAFIMLIVFQ